MFCNGLTEYVKKLKNSNWYKTNLDFSVFKEFLIKKGD